MRILFTSGRGFLPQNSGGLQSSTTQLAGALKERGNDVAVMCKLTEVGWTALRSRIQRRVKSTRFSRDIQAGLPVFRAWDPTETREVVERFQPDVAIVQSGDTIKIANDLIEHGVPVVFYYRNVEFTDLGGNPGTLTGALHIANSAFTAGRYKREFGIEATVIRPLVRRADYVTESSRQNVLFINPYPVKGRDIAFAIAERCPDIPFTFCESWTIDDELRAWLDERLKGLNNIVMRDRTEDMKTVYGKAKVLLAPSIWEEAWGRVATEAQFSGIPVLGSNRGGLPEAIGPGGVILDPEAPIEEWVAALRRLWDDKEFYVEKSRLALEHSTRSQIDPDDQVNSLIALLQQAINASDSKADSNLRTFA